MPTSMIAAINSEVATGRRMKMREGLIVRIPLSLWERVARCGAARRVRVSPLGNPHPPLASRAVPPLPKGEGRSFAAPATALGVPLAARLLSGRRFGSRRRTLLCRRCTRRSGGDAGLDEPYLGALLQPVGAVGDDAVAGLDPV